MKTQIRYVGHIVGVNSTYRLTGLAIGGFLPKVSGTITVVDANGVTLVDAVPVTAGVYVQLPLFLNGVGGTFTTAGGATGTLFT